ncbi:hypothetical protein ROZALSC1DRAFT_30763 [Rozella allomycis CSF55]|uniref:Uncharacterized protein n=1 Tax=Rozella allomycis (strain CSF55) TaxID=988480 RepID=A0A4P9YDP0_ROZAC|nr:hypothetical protein ROZALSC1DRAFT_30763 [Rozella allomycis CSF55]
MNESKDLYCSTFLNWILSCCDFEELSKKLENISFTWQENLIQVEGEESFNIEIPHEPSLTILDFLFKFKNNLLCCEETNKDILNSIINQVIQRVALESVDEMIDSVDFQILEQPLFEAVKIFCDKSSNAFSIFSPERRCLYCGRPFMQKMCQKRPTNLLLTITISLTPYFGKIKSLVNN